MPVNPAVQSRAHDTANRIFQNKMIRSDGISDTDASSISQAKGSELPGPRPRTRRTSSTDKKRKTIIDSQSNSSEVEKSHLSGECHTRSFSPTFEIADILGRTSLNDKPTGPQARVKGKKASSAKKPSGKRDYSTFGDTALKERSESHSVIEISD
jgi:hypothetical protein